MAKPQPTPDPIPAWRIGLWAGLAGFGLAGLFDTLLRHRLLGWHHLLDDAAESPIVRDLGWFAAFGILPALIGRSMRATT